MRIKLSLQIIHHIIISLKMRFFYILPSKSHRLFQISLYREISLLICMRFLFLRDFSRHRLRSSTLWQLISTIYTSLPNKRIKGKFTLIYWNQCLKICCFLSRQPKDLKEIQWGRLQLIKISQNLQKVKHNVQAIFIPEKPRLDNLKQPELLKIKSLSLQF